jgi:hypothetical protein
MGHRVSESNELRSDLRTSWLMLCDALKSLPDEVIAVVGAPTTAVDLAEGYRYLARQARIALEDFVEYNDASNPFFYEFTTPTRKTGIDNPDTIYLTTGVSPGSTYRVFGNVGTVAYIGFGLYAGFYGASDGLQTLAHYNLSDFSVEPGGEIELHLSAQEVPGRNWIPLVEGARRFDVRQSLLRRDAETPASLQIEVLSGPRNVALSPERVGRGLVEATEYVGLGLPMWARFVQGLQERTNQLTWITRQLAADLLSNMDTYYASGYWALDPGRALLVTIEVPPCQYWSFQIASHWMESFADRRTVINGASAVLDGTTCRVVLAASDPGVPNWLDTSGYTCGTMTLRAVMASASPTAETQLTTVERASLLAGPGA